MRPEDAPVPAQVRPAPPLATAATRTETTSRVTSAGVGAEVEAGIGTEQNTESDRARVPADSIATNSSSFSIFNCGTKKKRVLKLFNNDLDLSVVVVAIDAVPLYLVETRVRLFHEKLMP